MIEYGNGLARPIEIDGQTCSSRTMDSEGTSGLDQPGQGQQSDDQAAQDQAQSTVPAGQTMGLPRLVEKQVCTENSSPARERPNATA